MYLFKGMIKVSRFTDLYSQLFNLQSDFGKTRPREIKRFQTLEKLQVL